MNVNPKQAFKGHIVKMPSLKENFGLTKSEFEQYVENLRNGDESLITQVFKSHFHYSVNYVMQKFSISEELAYDNCMETMLDFREKIIAGKIQYSNLCFLYTRMAVNRFIDGIKHKKKINIAVEVFSKCTCHSNIDKEKFMRILEKSIIQLDSKSQEFLNAHFYSNTELIEIAHQNNEQYATIRKRKQRTLDKLKTIFLEILKGDSQS